jgi:hypothetical protein
MELYLTRIGKSLKRLEMSHTVPAGNQEAIVAFNFISERAAQLLTFSSVVRNRWIKTDHAHHLITHPFLIAIIVCVCVCVCVCARARVCVRAAAEELDVVRKCFIWCSVAKQQNKIEYYQQYYY